ncbi:hypothetical protein [Caballeronia sp. GAWG1-5s-s]|uniref:hypothetical protein n=1 Tax=Caballeronia sp. GAWG1-5s-s TaxID=2921743 RepID=UPI0020289520|nr:hypothetical protein [Caballeronia sp. GAWG1-5s-s]
MTSKKPSSDWLSLADALAQPSDQEIAADFDVPRADIRCTPAELDAAGKSFRTSVADHIAKLAKQHGVEYVETGNSALARVITYLCDDDMPVGGPDRTEKLVIALRKANVISGRTMVELLGKYFDELAAASVSNRD